jgi:hypothetical protein
MSTSNRNKLKRYYGPGVWEDQDGALHFSLPDILAHLGLADTPENQAMAEQVLRELLAKDSPRTEIIKRETPED